MDFDPTALFECSWGDIRLFASSLEWVGGETQVTHDLAVGDVHPLQHRGSRLRTATAQLQFDSFAGESASGHEAFRRFQATTRERRIFTHPMDGAFFARIGDLRNIIDEHSVVRATVEILPDEAVDPVAPAGAGTLGSTGEGLVFAAADKLASELSSRGIGLPPDKLKRLDFNKPISVSVNAAFSTSVDASASFSANVSASASASASAGASASASASALAFSDVYASALAVAQTSAVAQVSGMAGPSAFAFAYASAALDADIRSSVASWVDEEASPRSIAIDAARLSEGLSLLLEVGGFMDDLELWPAFRAAILLGDSLHTAVSSATSETSTVFVVRVQRPTALIALAASVYGGRDAQARARQIASLNDIRTPGWLDVGDYLMPERPVGASTALLGDPE